MESGHQILKKSSEISTQKINPDLAANLIDRFLNILDKWGITDGEVLPTEELVEAYMRIGLVESDHNWEY